MDPSHDLVLDQIARGTLRRTGGLKVARLLDVEPDWFDGIRSEVFGILDRARPSDVTAAGHVSNWVSPTGTALQYSLYNRSGDTADTSDDHDQRTEGKRFHDPDRYPGLASLLDEMPGLLNARINVLGHRGGLGLHEEQIRRIDGREIWFRLRVHLPISTNPDAVLILDRDVVHLEPGSLYAFNNGCVHSARNTGTEARVHVVFDLQLTAPAMQVLFGPGPPPARLHRVVGAGRQVPVRERERLPRSGYRVEGQAADLHRRLRLDRLGIPAWRVRDIHRYADRLRYLRHHLAYAPSN